MCYDYSECCCGKDQCDRNSVVVKNLIHSSVDAGHNLLSASNIFDALLFANEMENTKVGFAETYTSLSVLNRKTMPDKSQYHSVEFNENLVRFW